MKTDETRDIIQANFAYSVNVLKACRDVVFQSVYRHFEVLNRIIE